MALSCVTEFRKELSPRMTDIAREILRGNTSAKGIAFELGISQSTVKNISTILYARLGVQGAVELIVKHRDGVISSDTVSWCGRKK